MSTLQRLTGAFKRAIAAPRTPAQQTPAPSNGLHIALELHQSGRLAEAELAYGAILSREPDNADALQLAGVLAYQTGAFAKASGFLQRAATLPSANASIWTNLALANQAQGRLAEAQDALENALRIQPNSDTAHALLGSVLVAREHPDEAEGHLVEAIRLNPANVEALNQLGDLSRARANWAAAEDLYRRALALRTDSPELCVNLAMTLHQRGRWDEAHAVVSRALALSPSAPETLNSLGVVLSGLDRLAEAKDVLRRVLQEVPDHIGALLNLATVLEAEGALEEAERCCRRAIALRPNLAGAHSNLAIVHRDRGDFDQAERSCLRALECEPSHAAAHDLLGHICADRMRYADSERHFALAREADPTNAQFELNAGSAALLRGDYARGLELYEARIRDFRVGNAATVLNRLNAIPFWRGQPLARKRIAIWAEQGLGDSIMAMRYLASVKALGASNVALLCGPPMRKMLMRVDGVDEVLDPAEAHAEQFDFQCPMMSLPHRFNTRLESIPAVVPYLTVPEAAAREWRARLATLDGLKVGLAWAGNPKLRDDRVRSLKLSQLAPLGRVKRVSYVSLQKGEAAGQCREWSGSIANWMSSCDDLLDTAALISQLDLVISVDTAVAHLAGALGTPVWLLARSNGDWRWGVEGEHTPWYPTMRLYRQSEPRMWGPVTDRIAKDLAWRSKQGGPLADVTCRADP